MTIQVHDGAEGVMLVTELVHKGDDMLMHRSNSSEVRK